MKEHQKLPQLTTRTFVCTHVHTRTARAWKPTTPALYNYPLKPSNLSTSRNVHLPLLPTYMQLEGKWAHIVGIPRSIATPAVTLDTLVSLKAVYRTMRTMPREASI